MGRGAKSERIRRSENEWKRESQRGKSNEIIKGVQEDQPQLFIFGEAEQGGKSGEKRGNGLNVQKNYYRQRILYIGSDEMGERHRGEERRGGESFGQIRQIRKKREEKGKKRGGVKRPGFVAPRLRSGRSEH